ncbi:hypothetical protein EPR50_G00032250 [Perca flavescens]|uniref:Uncharacterized protein n=1 Tax=Perca flavescens TaxID=8167 RepID=A0A484DM29_PERFV|nr:hypothetical protein EPR50_G00032250 [Perca flavescens]
MAQSEEGITVYLKAAALDPAFCLLWVEPHALVNRDIKAEVAPRVKDLTLRDAAETEQPVPVPAEEEELEDMEGEGLFAAYHKRQRRDVGTPPAVAEFDEPSKLLANENSRLRSMLVAMETKVSVRG